MSEETGEKIIKINIEEEMKTAYIDYSMSVIVARALPDVRDGPFSRWLPSRVPRAEILSFSRGT